MITAAYEGLPEMFSHKVQALKLTKSLCSVKGSVGLTVIFRSAFDKGKVSLYIQV